MELREYVRIARKQWYVLALAVAIGLGVSALITLLTPASYQATTRMFVSTTAGEDPTALLQGSSFSQQRVKSYADVVASPRVLKPVIKSLGLKMSPSELAQNISVSVPVDTVLIDVTVTDRSPQSAATIAAAVGETFKGTVAELETLGASKPSPVKVSVVASPTVPTAAVSPKPVRNLALGGVVGLILGCVASLLREVLDTRIKNPEGCAQVTDAPVIGGIAFDADASKHPLVIQTDPHSVRAESFRSLRTNLQYVDAAKHPRSFVFTSSVPNEGKSTTAANVATTLAAGGMRVCVVEADLRRPKLLEYMGLEGGVGLTTVLIGQAEIDDVLQEFGGMSVLGAGHVPPNPSELLGSAAMRETLRELERRFDIVVIDAPPLLPVTDAAVLSTVADGTVVVVGVGSTKREQLAAAVSALDHVQANMLGLVLNKLPVRGPDSYNYGYYREGYQSGRSSTQATSHRERGKEAVRR